MKAALLRRQRFFRKGDGGTALLRLPSHIVIREPFWFDEFVVNVGAIENPLEIADPPNTTVVLLAGCDEGGGRAPNQIDSVVTDVAIPVQMAGRDNTCIVILQQFQEASPWLGQGTPLACDFVRFRCEQRLVGKKSQRAIGCLA